MKFKDQEHRLAYHQLIEEMYLTNEEIKKPSRLLKRQMAFAYLIALHQRDYEAYEGVAFYIEWGEELSVGGPTYLMEECIGERKHAHERIVATACKILKGEVPNEGECPGEEQFIKEAMKIAL